MQEQYLTGAELAKLLGVARRTVENWAAEGKIERGQNGYPVFSAALYRIKLLEERVLRKEKTQEIDNLKDRKILAECRKLEAEADLKELERDTRKGELVEAEAVIQEWENLIINCRAKLLSIPAKLALELSAISDPAAIEQCLQKIIDQALCELSDS